MNDLAAHPHRSFGQRAAEIQVLFLLKQVISLWPILDMRRMHRMERGAFGVMEALAALRWRQMAWDALAVALVCVLTALWVALTYVVGWGIWQQTGTAAALFCSAALAAEALFVAIIPAGAILLIDSFWIRIAVAALSAPVYA